MAAGACEAVAAALRAHPDNEEVLTNGFACVAQLADSAGRTMKLVAAARARQWLPLCSRTLACWTFRSMDVWPSRGLYRGALTGQVLISYLTPDWPCVFHAPASAVCVCVRAFPLPLR